MSDLNKTGRTNAAVYGLGFVGAVVYYLQQATTFTGGLIGIIKAILWPALLVYELLGYLQM
ncbi:hypothetical protein A2V80_01330 [Candidatus Woesebacteria bacterium RBG_16_39_8b]|uniref:Uncharacterized protein n=1 Tax=Candidatus Woesebacteria bacterium RBG_16_39_8b TaxID=1802482 RepID=A0A1F7XJU4_9BACT|nr:MAG: hypothetical protein A2V80_01330 [Candidatus Woesebacteria bacterium RBG_16_39_8b]